MRTQLCGHLSAVSCGTTGFDASLLTWGKVGFDFISGSDGPVTCETHNGLIGRNIGKPVTADLLAEIKEGLRSKFISKLPPERVLDVVKLEVVGGH